MDTNYTEKFKKTTINLLNLLKSIITELHEEKFVGFNENAVTIIITLLDAKSGDDLIWCLASVCKDWHKIISKDPTFVTQDFTKAIRSSGLPLDTNILTCPFTCYDAISKSNAWKDVEKDDWPVSDEDLDCIWEKIHLLARITCHYIHNLRKKNLHKPMQPKLDPVYENMELDTYARMFGVQLS